MAIDGTYNVEMQTPRGTQTGQLIIKAAGNQVSGTYKSARGDQNFTGTADGDNLAWSINMQGPAGSMKLDYKVKITGDELSGTVQLGQFGNAPIKGKKG